MKEKKTQVILISSIKSRIDFAVKNLKDFDNNLKIVITKDVTSSLQHLDTQNTFSLMVIMVGYTYFDTFDDDYINKFITINNCEDFNLKILIIQPFISQSLHRLNTTTLAYLKENISQFKNIEVLNLFDSDRELNLISLN